MPPTMTGPLVSDVRLYSRADSDYNFDSTPVEAVVVPIAILILLLASAAMVSVFRYWRRRNAGDSLGDKNPRKFIPNWLGDWLGSARSSKSSQTGYSLENVQKPVSGILDDSNAQKAGVVDLAKTSKDKGSDTMAVRPISVYIPTYPLLVHDPYDRYAVASPATSVRPKVLSVPYR